MKEPTLYLMLGLPGAGKTTTSNELAQLTGAVHLSSDAFRLQMYPKPTYSQHEHDTLYRTLDFVTELLLKNGNSVIYDANLNRREHRNEKYALAKRLHVQAELIWVQVDRAIAHKRALTIEDRSLRPFGPMPEDMFERISDLFEPPAVEEKAYELDGTKITPEYLRTKLGLS